uniref:Uncharacterized protein n=1 Tax=Oryza glumipatula TaxID=40148 RepID=A0A0E0B7E3_9ORYZ
MYTSSATASTSLVLPEWPSPVVVFELQEFSPAMSLPHRLGLPLRSSVVSDLIFPSRGVTSPERLLLLRLRYHISANFVISIAAPPWPASSSSRRRPRRGRAVLARTSNNPWNIDGKMMKGMDIAYISTWHSNFLCDVGEARCPRLLASRDFWINSDVTPLKNKSIIETPEHVLINQQANTLMTIWNSVNPHLDLSDYLESGEEVRDAARSEDVRPRDLAGQARETHHSGRYVSLRQQASETELRETVASMLNICQHRKSIESTEIPLGTVGIENERVNRPVSTTELDTMF